MDNLAIYDIYDEGYKAGYRACQQYHREYKRKARERELMRQKKKIQRIKQKALGTLMVAAGVASVFIEYDATAAVVIVPLGLYTMFTNENVFSEGEQ